MLGLGAFRPDLTDTSSKTLADLLNASIKPEGEDDGIAYGPLLGLTVASTAVALPAAPKGTLSCVTALGVYVNFVMTATTIYKIALNGSYTVIGTGYALPPGNKWGRTQFGTKAIFSNTVDGMLQYDFETGGAVTAITNAPKARGVSVVFDTLFAWDCDGENKLIRNSDFTYTNWLTGVSGYQPEPDGEEVMGVYEIVDGIAVVVHRNAVRIMQRIPSAQLYVQQLLSRGNGAVNPWCIVSAAGAVYCYGAAGFLRITPAGVENIGYGKVDKWFAANSTQSTNSGMEGAYDPERQVIRWRYETGDDAGGPAYARSIDYDMRTGEFVPLEGSTTALFTTALTSYTMEELDAFGTMETITTSLDDRAWFGGSPMLGAFNSAYKIGYFTGAALAATFETATISENLSSRITSLRPVTDAASATVQVGRSDRLSAALTWNTAAGVEASGRVSLVAPTRGKNHRLRAAIPAAATWTYMRGFDDIQPRMGGPK